MALSIGSFEDVPEIQEHSVVFVDGTKIDNIDAIVFGTGYLPDFPFLSPDVIEEDKSNLYFSMYPERKNQTLAIIGCFTQKGPAFPRLEMQSRLATRVFKGLVKLPDKNAMWMSIKRNNSETQKERVATTVGVIQYDHTHIVDELATIIGCKPNFLKLVSISTYGPSFMVRSAGCYTQPSGPNILAFKQGQKNSIW